MSHPKTGICLVYKSPGRVLPRVDVVNEVLLHVGDGLQQPQPNVLGVSVGDVHELSLEAGPVPVFAGELKSLSFFLNPTDVIIGSHFINQNDIQSTHFTKSL